MPPISINKIKFRNAFDRETVSTSCFATELFFFFFFFLKFLADTCPFLGPLVPLFWISGDVSSGFQSQSGLPYSHCGGKRNVRSPRSTSGATLADLLAAGAQPVLSPHTVVSRGEVAGNLIKYSNKNAFYSNVNHPRESISP